jgi:hypothetical protein
MNPVNRLLIIVQLLIAIALMPITIVILLFFRPAIVGAVDNLARGLVAGPNAGYTQAICVGLAALVFLLAILLLFLELHRPAVHGLRVQQVTDGQVEVTADAIIHRLEHDILRVADVTKVKPHVVAASKGAVDLFLELETHPEVNVPQKTQEVIDVAKQVMAERMGLKLGKIQVQLGHAWKPKKQPPEREPAPAGSGQAPSETKR